MLGGMYLELPLLPILQRACLELLRRAVGFSWAARGAQREVELVERGVIAGREAQNVFLNAGGVGWVTQSQLKTAQLEQNAGIVGIDAQCLNQVLLGRLQFGV